jgi:DNA-binding NtrC family response regulator
MELVSGRLKEAVEEAERKILADALRRHGGSRVDAAGWLGCHERTLYVLLRKYPDLAEKYPPPPRSKGPRKIPG